MRLRPNSIVSRAIAGLALIWFVGVILAYFAVHKPISASQVEAVRDLVLTGIGWTSAVALANLLGWMVLRRLSNFTAVERLALQIGLGFGLISLALLTLGFLRGYSQLLLWLLLLIPLPITLYRIRTDLRGIERPSGRWLMIFVSIASALIALRALSPPTAWDSLVYHLTGPKLYQQAGRIHHDVDLAYLGFPKAGLMLFLLGQQIAGPSLAQLFHATFFVLTLVLMPGLVRSAAPGRGWLAIAVLVAVPSAALLAGWAHVEWLGAFAGLASFTLIRVSDSRKVDRALILAGFLAALALNTKYTAVWLVIGLSLVVFLRGRSVRRWGAYLLSTSSFTAPFLLANLVLTKNPVYPFIFEGVFWDSHRTIWFSRFGTGLSLPEILVAPWEASVWGLEGGFFEGHASYGATIGPLLLALIPLLALRLLLDRSDRRGNIRDLVVVAGVAYLGWVIQLSSSSLLVQSRLLFPVLPFFAALAAVGFDTVGQVGRWGVSVRFILGGLIALILVLTATSMIFETVNAGFLNVILGTESKQSYLTRRLGWHYEAMREINRLEGRAKVRFLWEPRSYYCGASAQCEPDALLDRWWHDRQHFTAVEELQNRWVEDGVTHVLFHRAGAEAVRSAGFDPFESDDWSALDRFIQQHLVPVRAFGDAYVLYEFQR
ncbi:MAG: hypothetical protein ACE5JF_05155 [Anaerolineales bacterium]